MHNFGVLYIYELKKIWKRRIVWITLLGMMLVMAVMGVFTVLTDYQEVNGVEMRALDAMKQRREYARALTGQAIDEELITKMQEGYISCRVIERENAAENSSSEVTITEIEEDAGAEYLAYEEVYEFVENVVGKEAALTITAGQLYQSIEDDMLTSMKNKYLTEGEMNYWIERVASVEKPIRISYTKGPVKVWISFYTVSILLLLLEAISLANVFAEEHQKKTDQLILCSRHGRSKLYFCKMAAGISFGIVGALLLFLSFAVPVFSVYGVDGLGAAIQIYMPGSPFPFAIGQWILILLGIYLLASIIFSVFTMVGSELFRNGVASMAVMVSGMLLTMMGNVPDHYRVLSQLYDMLPHNVLAVWSTYDTRLVPWFGGYLTNYQATPILYVAVSGVMLWLGYRVYRRFQVSGR